jgi:hypothetical protein
LIYLSVFSDVYLCQNDIGNTNILTKQFLPARMALLADYWQKIVDKTVEKWRFAEVDYSSNIRGNFCIVAVLMATTTTHCLSTIHDHLCTSQVTCTRVKKILDVDTQYTAKVKNL